MGTAICLGMCKVASWHCFQKHLLWMTDGPSSSYSSLEIHMDWNEGSDESIEPPIQTEQPRSGGAKEPHSPAWRGQCCELMQHALSKAREHGRAARENHIAEQVRPEVSIAPHNRVKDQHVNARGLSPDQTRLEERLWAPETLAADCNETAIWQCIDQLMVTVLRRKRDLRVQVEGDIASLLLDITCDVSLSA